MNYSGAVTRPDTLGFVLQQARLLQGKTQRQLAEELGVSQRYIWEMEAGKPTIYSERLFKMINALGIDIVATIHEPLPNDEPSHD